MSQGRETVGAGSAARSGAAGRRRALAANPADANAMQALLGAEAGLGAALGGLKVTMEDYPELKADQTMGALMEQLTSTENKVAFARQAFNDAVNAYNDRVGMVPGVLVAGPFGFHRALQWQLEEERARLAPKVAFQ